MSLLTITQEEHPAYILMELSGSINSSNATQITEAIDSITLSNHKHFLLDLSRLRSINSVGLQALLKCRQTTPYSQMILFCSPSPAVTALIEISGITAFIPVISDITQAETLLQDLTLLQQNAMLQSFSKGS